MTFAWKQPCPRSLKKFFEKTAADTSDTGKPKEKNKKDKGKHKDKDGKEKRKCRETDDASEPPSKTRKTRK